MCISSISSTFRCKICNTNIKDTDSAAQCDICQFWIHMTVIIAITLIINIFKDQMVLGSASLVVMKSFHSEH